MILPIIDRLYFKRPIIDYLKKKKSTKSCDGMQVQSSTCSGSLAASHGGKKSKKVTRGQPMSLATSNYPYSDFTQKNTCHTVTRWLEIRRV